MGREKQFQLYSERFRGLYDNIAVSPGWGFVRKAENFFLRNGVYEGRPGLTALGSALDAAKVQAVAMFEQRNTGARHRIAFCNGRMFQFSYITGTFTEVALAGGVVIDPDADLDWCVFNNKLVVTDGVNLPWSWDGTTFARILEAPIARCCTVYYLKLFFGDIPAEPSTFMWSEEGDEQAGYEGPHPNGGNYDNAWTFGQTDPGRIYKLVGLNEVLLVFKEDTIAAVRGAVEEGFQTTATREGVSDSFGIFAARSAIVQGGSCYFLASGGPRVIHGGSSVAEDLTLGRLSETWADFLEGDATAAVGVYDGTREHHLWLLPPRDTPKKLGIGFSPFADASLDQPDQGFFTITGWDVQSAGEWEDDDGMDEVVIGDSDGQVWAYGRPDMWNDGAVVIERVLEGHGDGRNDPSYKNFDRLDFLFRVRTAATVSIRPVGDNRLGNAIEVELSSSTLPRWGTARWGTARWAGQGGELVKYSRGLDMEAIECGWRITQAQDGETVDVVSARLWGTIAGVEPYTVDA